MRSKDRVESTLKADRTLKGMDWIYLAQARVLWRVVNTVSIKRCGISWLAEVLLGSPPQKKKTQMQTGCMMHCRELL